MSATSLKFILFAVAVAVLHGLWSNKTWRSTLFLIANILFIASYTTSPRILLPLIIFLLWGYLAVRAAPHVKATWLRAVFVLGTLFIFCYLKKYFFLSFLNFLPFTYFTLGLSYMFFRVMGFIIDAQSEPELARVGPIDFLNFAVNFPTLIAGPIDRYQEFSKPPEPVTPAFIGEGIERIVIGFFKVMVLSAIVSKLHTEALVRFGAAGTADGRILESLSVFGLYPIYLYFNFSGYTDIVIGIGNLFGKRYPENFNAPFSAYTFIEFWSRWHMSLSNWLRDYVYTPFLMTLMQRNFPRGLDPYLGVLAYFVTFFLIGIWHGSTLIFAIYGMVLGFGVAVNKLHQTFMPKFIGKKQYRELCARAGYRLASRSLTYTWYSFCMLCFWAAGTQAMAIVGKLGAVGMAVSFVLLFLLTTLVLNPWELAIAAIRKGLHGPRQSAAFPYVRAAAAGVLVFACIAIAMLTQTVDSDIIYQAF